MHWFTTAFDGIVSFLPSLVAGLVILVVGWAIASLLSRLTRAVLGRVGYDPFLAKLGLVDEEKTASHAGSRWTGKVVYVLVMLAAFMQAARAWDVQMLSDGIAGILLYVPHLLGAVFIFGASLYFGNWVRDRIARSKAAQERTSQRPLVGSTVRAGILALGAFMALREMQIAPEIVTIAFTVTVAAIALAAALAFGLGSRSVAGQVTQDWYERRPGPNGARGNVPPSPPAQAQAPTR